MIYDLLETFVTHVYCTSETSLAIGRGRDNDSVMEIPFKPIKNENVEEEVKETKLIITRGKVMYSWGKGMTGCLGFGD